MNDPAATGREPVIPPPQLKRFRHVGYPRGIGLLTGGPVYWRDEQSGELKAAVEAYLWHVTDGKPLPTQAQLDLLGEYCAYWIFAPCWAVTPFVEDLRARAPHPGVTLAELAKWLSDAFEEGIDPL